ncbi:MAG TPA: hypothetical protein VNM66_02710 [Thermodesulfobacteriota bacterium]|nr:hypothetical protein [Thermodesulfobacteriota bacterium]
MGRAELAASVPFWFFLAVALGLGAARLYAALWPNPLVELERALATRPDGRLPRPAVGCPERLAEPVVRPAGCRALDAGLPYVRVAQAHEATQIFVPGRVGDARVLWVPARTLDEPSGADRARLSPAPR